MKTISSAKLSMDRTTKGAVLYKNQSTAEGVAVTSIYLRKSGLSAPYPSEITVTVLLFDD